MELLKLVKRKLIKKENCLYLCLQHIFPLITCINGKRESSIACCVQGFLFHGFDWFFGLVLLVCFGFFNMKLAPKSFPKILLLILKQQFQNWLAFLLHKISTSFPGNWRISSFHRVRKLSSTSLFSGCRAERPQLRPVHQ